MIYDEGAHTFTNLSEVVDDTVALLRRYTSEFDSIVVRGISGIVVGSPVSLALKKPLVIVRKPGDGSHSPRTVENIENVGSRYLFLDDFLSMGTTRRAVAEEIHNEGGPEYPHAQFLYEDMDYQNLYGALSFV
jgi:adenine/guanine phosphoribosyltransferase-like PRPP-binding protein